MSASIQGPALEFASVKAHLGSLIGYSQGRKVLRQSSWPASTKKTQQMAILTMHRVGNIPGAHASDGSVRVRRPLLVTKALACIPMDNRVKEAIEEKNEGPQYPAPIARPLPTLSLKLKEVNRLGGTLKPKPELLAIQKWNLEQWLQQCSEDYVRQAAKNPGGKLLINRHTAVGKQLIESCFGRSLEEIFNIHGILVEMNGRIFIRSTEKPFEKGGVKKIFAAEEYRTKREYVWSVAKQSFHPEVFSPKRNKVLHELDLFLRDHLHLAFTPFPWVVNYQRIDGQKDLRGVNICRRFKDDLCTLVQKGICPAIFAPAIIKLAEGLTALHQSGLVHRDIKPENILLDDYHRAFWHDYDFVDFADNPSLNGVFGTPGYLSLEYALIDYFKIVPEKHDLRAADVFAFAMVLFLDVDPSFQETGYDHTVEGARESFRNALQKFASKDILVCTPKEKNAALNKWLRWKHDIHQAKAPSEDDDKPYLEYRQFLWKALSPISALRPDTAAFEAGLKELAEKELLPISFSM